MLAGAVVALQTDDTAIISGGITEEWGAELSVDEGAVLSKEAALRLASGQ
jgi:hypothetical protein